MKPRLFVRAMSGDLLVPSVDAGRFCLRCGIAVHVPDPAHVCKDILNRLKVEAQKHWQDYANELVMIGGEG